MHGNPLCRDPRMRDHARHGLPDRAEIDDGGGAVTSGPEHVAYLCHGNVECCGEHGGWTVCCDEPDKHEPVAIQTHCLHCGRKQWEGTLVEVSYGRFGCLWCGVPSTPMTSRQYREARIAAARLR